MWGVVGVLVLGAGFAGRKYLDRASSPTFEKVSTQQIQAVPSKVDPAIAKEVVVNVNGEVKQPGVFRLKETDRVNDAIAKAGGATEKADLEQLNLAAKLIDGSVVNVPAKATPGKETPSKPVTNPNYAGRPERSSYSSKPTKDPSGPRTSGAKTGPSSPINLNTASSEQLQEVPGIGPSTAEKIIEYRHEHGGFGSVDELRAVKGIGPKKLEKMKKFLRV
jgi:competence protein ComEA